MLYEERKDSEFVGARKSNRNKNRSWNECVIMIRRKFVPLQKTDQMLDYLFLFLALALLAEILGTVGGFGSSLFFVPLAGFFLDFHSALGVTALFHLSSNVTKIAMFRKGFDRKLILSLGVPAVISVLIGAYFSQYVISESLEIFLAAFLLVIGVVFLIFQEIRVKPNIRNSLIGGTLSGGIAGLIGTGGAIRGITLTAFGLPTQVFIATSAVIDLGVDASRSVVYWTNGYVHSHDLYLIPPLVVVSIVGTWVGKWILERVSEERFRRIVLILVMLTGVSTLMKVLL